MPKSIKLTDDTHWRLKRSLRPGEKLNEKADAIIREKLLPRKSDSSQPKEMVKQ